jgi:hypothetical protein
MMVEKDNKEKLRALLENIGIGFTDPDELIEKSKITVKKSDEVK